MSWQVPFFRVCAAVLVLAASPAAYAAHPYVTDDTGTQGKGNWQLELMAERGRDTASANTVRQESTYSVFNPVLTYGLLDNLDLALGATRLNQRVTGNGAVVFDASGQGDSSLELKWRFYEEGKVSLALKPGISLPTGDDLKGLGTGRAGWATNLIMTYDAKPWTFLGNLAYQRVSYADPAVEAANRANLWRISAGFAYAVLDKLRLVGEAGTRTNPLKNDPFLPEASGRFAMAGLIYSPTEKIDFDLGLRKGLNRGEIDTVLLAGATLRW